MLLRLFAHTMCVFFLSLPASAVPVFNVQAVGPAGYTSSATAINATGAVVGNYAMPDGTYRAFLWQDGQVSTLALPSGAFQTWANAISGSGQVGGYADSAQGARGVIWDNLGTPSATAASYIMGLNTAGDAAGMAIANDGSGYAYLSRNGTITSLGQPAGGDWSSANAISSTGAAAGSAMTANGAFRAFSAGANGAATLLAGLGGANSYAKAINSAGTVAGHSQDPSAALRATIWQGTSPTSLGTLGGINSYAYGINDSGQVVGYSDLTGDAGTAAFLFASGSLYNLNTLLTPGSGWQIQNAYGINSAGQIVGTGIYNGEQLAVLLTPQPGYGTFAEADPGPAVPEPSTFLLISSAALGYLALRLRTRP